MFERIPKPNPEPARNMAQTSSSKTIWSPSYENRQKLSANLAAQRKPQAKSTIPSHAERSEMARKQAQQRIASKQQAAATPMPAQVQAKMENSFDTDFSTVQLYKDSAQALNLGAQAYTQGEEIYFAPGRLDFGSRQGQELLGHELTHVVQQREGRVQPTVQMKGVGMNEDQALEQEADVRGRMAANGNVNANEAMSTLETACVQITITDKIAGYGDIRIIDAEDVAGCPKTMSIPLYKMTITDEVTGTQTVFLVSRDGPAVMDKNADGTFTIVNTSFEPEDGHTDLTGIMFTYPAEEDHKTDLPATALRNEKGGLMMPAEYNPYAVREDPDMASEVMIHVGGTYQTLKDIGTKRSDVAGSLGCFGIFPDDGAQYSNQETKDFGNDVNRRLSKIRNAGKSGKVCISIEKRSIVPLLGRVDAAGNIVEVSEYMDMK